MIEYEISKTKSIGWKKVFVKLEMGTIIVTMTEKDDQQRLWKEEAEQQRQDNLRKGRIIKRREVPIRFGGKKPLAASDVRPLEETDLDTHRSEQDDHLRRQLGV